ncbi:MAG: PaaI family thioesterase [Deltaproteobacteria bacterium]|nr:PaaI family thioesterase [Deltaproteobacteria bacterium]MBW1994043.1 PaaI family thioesterase [Deltaproteobacteria bacterium]MBW2153587.1 PaaI family thioesterase [Deltaproteobacteria bacterium]
MESAVRDAIFKAVETEPFARQFKIRLVRLNDGYSEVEMTYEPERMDNIYRRAHGGAIFALIDEAFETAGQTDGTIAVALNVNVTYISSPKAGARLRATARLIGQSKKTASYEISVTDLDENIIATCQALAYRTGKQIPFLERR